MIAKSKKIGRPGIRANVKKIIWFEASANKLNAGVPGTETDPVLVRSDSSPWNPVVSPGGVEMRGGINDNLIANSPIGYVAITRVEYYVKIKDNGTDTLSYQIRLRGTAANEPGGAASTFNHFIATKDPLAPGEELLIIDETFRIKYVTSSNFLRIGLQISQDSGIFEFERQYCKVRGFYKIA